MISATLVGEAQGNPILRSGARIGDAVCVSGTIGGAAFAREILLGRRRGARRDTVAFRRPPVRLGLGMALARSRIASAAIDISDGLLSDLGHVCRASGVGAFLEASRLPLARSLRRLGADERLRLALAGGEDYELLFTVPARRVMELGRVARLTPVTVIGRIVRGKNIRVVDGTGAERQSPSRGFDHFRG
jgi:thiamine-monophosphate kinase